RFGLMMGSSSLRRGGRAMPARRRSLAVRSSTRPMHMTPGAPRELRSRGRIPSAFQLEQGFESPLQPAVSGHAKTLARLLSGMRPLLVQPTMDREPGSPIAAPAAGHGNARIALKRPTHTQKMPTADAARYDDAADVLKSLRRPGPT